MLSGGAMGAVVVVCDGVLRELVMTLVAQAGPQAWYAHGWRKCEALWFADCALFVVTGAVLASLSLRTAWPGLLMLRFCDMRWLLLGIDQRLLLALTEDVFPHELRTPTSMWVWW
jgi:hypothetical protein